VKLLRSLPAGSVPEKAARAYLLLAAGPAAEETVGSASLAAEVSEADVAGICRLVGATDVSAFLLRAENHWREERHAESYRVLRDGVRHFPSCELDWAGALSEFYFKAPHNMRRAQGLDFLRFFSARIFDERLKSGTEAMYVYRLFSLMGQAVAPASELCRDWESFLRERETLLGSNARFSSLAYGWLGEQLAMTRQQRGYFAGPPRLRNAEGAVEFLRRSIELDPGNLAANLQLCAVYGALKRNSERNRLLDEMTARFPDDKQVLVRAAEGCIERKAFGKGLGYLDRARQLDQLDPQIPDLTARALWAQARQQFEQQRPEKARQVFAQADAWLTDKPDNYQRSRWAALVRQALMERLWGDAARGEKLLAQAGGLASSRAVFLFFVHLAHRAHVKKFPRESPFLGELKAVLRKAPRLAEIRQLLRIVKFWHEEAEEIRTFDEEGLIAQAIPATLNQPFTRAEATDVMDCVGDNPEFTRSLKKLVKKFLRADPLDPQARLWAIDIDGLWTMDPSNGRAKFQAILDEATRRHDEASMRRARQLIRELGNSPPMPDPFEPHFVEPDEEEEENDEELDDDDSEQDDGPLPPFDLSPGMMEEFRELIDALRTAPESVIRDLRKTAARGMPDFVFETLVELAKNSPLPPVLPEFPAPPKAKPRPSEPAPDPNQLNLF
jgi:tetratricopeptide (TPR) repeat protein